MNSLEARCLAWAQLRKKTTIRTGDLQEAIKLTPRQEAKLLSRMALSGVAVRITRGVYLIPQKIPLGGKWSAPEALVLSELMKGYKGKYQLTGLQVFNHYGLTTQVSNQVTVYNNKISGKRTIAGMAYEFIKVPTKRLGGVEEVKTYVDVPLQFPTLGRALLDAVYDYSRFNTLPKAYDWIEKHKDNLNAMVQLLDAAMNAGNTATRRRIGYWLEKIKAPPRFSKQLLHSVPHTTWNIPFVPGRPKSGRISQRWGLVNNNEKD